MLPLDILSNSSLITDHLICPYFLLLSLLGMTSKRAGKRNAECMPQFL